MKITVNHVHSGSIELTQKEPPKAAPEQQNTTENVRRDNIRDKLNWALIGAVLGTGFSIYSNFIVGMIDELCGDESWCVFVKFIIYLSILYLTLFFAYRMSRKL